MASPGAVCSGTSRLGYSWIRWIYVLVLWISLCVDSGSGLYGHDRADYYGECAKFLYSSTVEPKLNRLLELHIRLNFRVRYVLQFMLCPFYSWWCLEASPTEFSMMLWDIIWSPPDRYFLLSFMLNPLLPDDAWRHHTVNCRWCFDASFDHNQIDTLCTYSLCN